MKKASRLLGIHVRTIQKWDRKGKKLWEKYGRRERNVCRDIERKIASMITEKFPNAMHYSRT